MQHARKSRLSAAARQASSCPICCILAGSKASCSSGSQRPMCSAHSRRRARVRNGQAAARCGTWREDGSREPCPRRKLDRLGGPRAVSYQYKRACRQADVVARPDGDHGRAYRVRERDGGRLSKRPKRPAARRRERRAESHLRKDGGSRRSHAISSRAATGFMGYRAGAFPGTCSERSNAPIRLAGWGSCRKRRLWGGHLRAARARFRPGLAAQPDAEPLLHPVRPRHRHRGLAG